LDESAASGEADDIIESSSPLRRDETDALSTSVVLPLTTTDNTASDSVLPPALSSLPSLLQLSRQALDSRAERTGMRSGNEQSQSADTSVIPPALSSLPSLLQLSRQALDLRAERTGLRYGNEMSMKSLASSHVAADMFSEDDDHTDSVAEVTQVR